MSDFYRDAERKPARKVHRCVMCWYPIAVGEVYTEQTGVFDGRGFRNRFHTECFSSLGHDGEFTPGDHDPPARLLADMENTDACARGQQEPSVEPEEPTARNGGHPPREDPAAR